MSSGNNHEGNGYGLLPPIRFEDLVGRDMSDGSNRRYHRPPSEYDHEFWHLGWTDGRHGQPPDDNIAIIRARARLAWQERTAAVDAEIGQTRALVRNLENTLGRLRAKLNLFADDYMALLRERSESPQSYSLTLWFIYSVVAGVLIAADLPLSLKLVAMGYGIEPDSTAALLLAFGVALSGILIKYLLDSFIYRDEQKTITRVFTVSLLCILILFLGTTVVLGSYRASVEQRVHIKERAKDLSDLKQERDTRARAGKPTQITDQAIVDAEDDIQRMQLEGWWSWRTGSFITLTLLFPIAGGICFSVGWRKLIRFIRFHSVDRAYKKAESTYRNEELLCEQARGRLESLEARRGRENEAYASGDAYADMSVGIYRHGYERGRNVPETLDANASLYDRCEKAANRLLAGKLRGRYWNEGSSSVSNVN